MGKHLYKKHYMTQGDLDYIVKMFYTDTPYKTIAERLGVPIESVSANVIKLKEAGILPNERKRRIKKAPPYQKKGGKHPVNREYAPEKVPEKPKGIKCTLKVATHCRYGCTDGTKHQGLCNYILVKNQRRGCDPCDCTRFEKITKQTPRYRWAGEEDDGK